VSNLKMKIDAFQTIEEYITWGNIFELFSMERFKPIYSMIGLPICLDLDIDSFVNISKQYIIESENTFSQGRHPEFKELQSCFIATLSRLEELYGETCLLNVLEWCHRYTFNHDQINSLFLWSLIIKRVINFDDYQAASIDCEFVSKVSSILTLEKYYLDKSNWENQLYEVSIQPMSDWENELSSHSAVTEADIFRDYFADSLSPYLVGRVSTVDLIRSYHYHYTNLSRLRAILSDREAQQFLCWAKSRVDEEEFSADKIIYPL
jgi:hypothetical protein